MNQSVAAEKFITRIKQKYKERRINREKQWPPCKSEKLVRLELVEGEQRQGYSAGQTRGRDDKLKAVKRSPLAYSNILKAKDDKKTVRKVLVEGDAGIGKTTLCTAVSEDWANEKLFQEFDILLLLPLRQKRIATAGSLLDLLKLLHPSQKVCELVCEYIEEEEGKVLIIADGWDELGREDRSEGSFLYELLFGECYLLSVIVTSRPSASAPLHKLPCIDRLVEVHGFSTENIEEFIQCEFADDRVKGSGLLKQLEGNTLIESVCSVPLNCAIVCHLWHHFKGALPTTMSKLYTKIILNVILRNIQKVPKYESIPSLPHFDALPEGLQQPWSLLCEIAFQTLREDKIVFSHEDLSKKFQHLSLGKEIFCFGLLQSAESILEVGHGVSFHFLHLTIQEYLAAFYIVIQPPDVQLMLVQSQIVGLVRFEMVWRFFFGISYAIYDGQRCSEVLFKKLIDAHHTDFTMMTLYHFGLEANHTPIDIQIASKISRWKLKEANKHLSERFQHLQEVSIFDAYQFIEFISDLHVSFFARTAHDFAAVVYVISKLQRCSDIKIEFSDFDLGDEQIAALVDALVGEHKHLEVVIMILRGNKLTDQGAADLFDRASPAFSRSLQQVYVENNRIGPKAITSITSVLAQSLCDDFFDSPLLNVSDNSLEVEGLKALRDAMCADKLATLTELFLAGSLTSDADTNAELILALGSGHCHSLEELDLSRNNLGVPGGKALGKVLPHLNSGVSLHLDETMLGDEGISAFTQNLDGTCKLGDLDLENNGIQAAGVSCLAECICAGMISLSSTSVSLINNPLGLGGVMVLFRMLNSCNFLSDCIDLSRCQLTTAGRSGVDSDSDQTLTCVGMEQFICYQPQLSRTNSITSLFIENTSFTGDHICILECLMYMCPHLEYLHCKNCEITSNDLEQLLVKLSKLNVKLPNLEQWDLSDNNIDDDGVSTLIQHLSMFPKLNSTGLDCRSQVSPKMLETLEENLVETPLQRWSKLQWKKIVHSQQGESGLTDLDVTIHGNKLREEDLDRSKAAMLTEGGHRVKQCSSKEGRVSTVTPAMKDMVERILEDEGVEQLQPTLDSEETTTAVETFKEPSLEGQSEDAGVDQLHPALDLEEITTIEGKSHSQSKQDVHLSTQSSAPLTLVQRLDKVLDLEHGGVSKHLGQTADAMYEWEGPIAEQLELTRANVAAIKTKYPGELTLQTRAALEKWKQKLGSNATYNNLIRVFEKAGYQDLADLVRHIAGCQDVASSQPNQKTTALA